MSTVNSNSSHKPKSVFIFRCMHCLEIFALGRIIAYGSLSCTFLYPFILCSGEGGELHFRVFARLVSMLKENAKQWETKHVHRSDAYVAERRSDFLGYNFIFLDKEWLFFCCCCKK